MQKTQASHSRVTADCILSNVFPINEERHASLQSGTQRKVTAVLVGDIGSQPTSTFTDFLSWFPSDLLSALSFASGTEVGRLWIEIRDGNGTLIRRLHGKSQLPSFWEGDELLEKYDRMDGNAAMGEFVAAYLAQPPDKRFYLEMAMNHARLGSIPAPFHLHDILDHLIRGLECLCREHKLVQQNLGSALSSKTKASVQAIVNEARLGLQKLADNSAASSALDSPDLRFVARDGIRASKDGRAGGRRGLLGTKLRWDRRKDSFTQGSARNAGGS